MLLNVFVLALGAQSALAFPFMTESAGGHAPRMRNEKRQSTCPFNPNHGGAAPYSSQYPYTYARNALPGTGIGGINVPAAGDTAHQYEPPGPNDIRGPCPGLNALANHHFISHDGVTTFTEMMDAQQNAFNTDEGLAAIFATIGTILTGDPVTEKMSIGCDATSRTSSPGSHLGSESGLSAHNKVESDTSLTRNDFFLSPTGDNYSLNTTLFGMMQKTCGGNFDRNGLSLYKYQRYVQSRADNGHLYFGPISLFFYGAASFLYELFPSYGNEGTPDLDTIKSFYGVESDGKGGFRSNGGERFPPNWYNRRTPYTIPQVAVEITALYGPYPALLGGNTAPGKFDALDFQSIKNGKIPADPATVVCLLYQIATDFLPTQAALPTEAISWILGKLNPVYKNFGCPLKLL